ncbi:bile acid:sodium symporter family protein [Nocardioides sp. NPDC051685]|uniref:bile acid:sodium symporter family protein n=1 Tax=Nocardioides sp. NPDC051685 TaxID=3364334 RepID=UPI0037A994AB
MLLGLVLRLLLPRLVAPIVDVLPLLSVGLLVVLAVVPHNVAGLALGYTVGRLCGMPISSRRAISIEVGMQNSGLAAALATVHFSPAAAALPAAIFSVWHNVSGSTLASYWSRRPIAGEDASRDSDRGAAVSS